MIEIFDITLLFVIFSLFLLSPISANIKNICGFDLNQNSVMTLNLILNINILLIFSILPLKLFQYYIYIILFLVIFLIANFFKNSKKLKVKENLSLFFIFFLIFFILSIDIANELNLGWDAKWFYLIESLFYSQGNTFKELAEQMFRDFHPHPHLGSYLWAFFSNLSINNHEYYGRLFYLFLFIFGLFLITKKIVKNKNYDLIILIILTIITYKYKYFSGLQEIIIFSNLIFISIIIYDYILEKKFTDLFIISLSLNLILWTKAEGIVYFLIVIGCINLIKRIDFSHRLKFNILCLSLILFKFLVYLFFEIRPNNQPYSLSFIENLNFEILFYQIYNITIYFVYNSINNIIYFIVLIVFFMNKDKIFKDEYCKIIFAFFLLNICFIYSAYILRDQEIIYSLKTTMDRVVFTSSGFYLFFIGLYFKKLSSKFIN